MIPSTSRSCTRLVAVPSEVIWVCFFLEDDRLEWWRGTVERVHPLSGRSDVLATAMVMCEAAYGYQKMRCKVDFFRNGGLRTDVDENNNRSRVTLDYEEDHKELVDGEILGDFGIFKVPSSKNCGKRNLQRRLTRNCQQGWMQDISGEEYYRIREA
eukprot:gb/GEZJ01000657.1/.p4 GENE.gb/GEZJ01000657.1/~~gb/GEZJ01000657.1/.p4  ORF type:complete len:156 (-),score=15.75 gb/GEZJ01000657.1/:1036-1503(-)